MRNIFGKTRQDLANNRFSKIKEKRELRLAPRLWNQGGWKNNGVFNGKGWGGIGKKIIGWRENEFGFRHFKLEIFTQHSSRNEVNWKFRTKFRRDVCVNPEIV